MMWLQRLAFTCLLFGFILCLLGAVSPYWREAQVDTNSTGFLGGASPYAGEVDTLPYHGGLFYYCVDIPGGGSACNVFDWSKGDGFSTSLLWMVMATLTLTLISTTSSLCCLCCDEDKASRCYRWQGGAALIGGVSGLTVTILYAIGRTDSWGMILDPVDNAWALFAFAAGSTLVTIIALALCMASPDGMLPCLVIKRRGYEDISRLSKAIKRSDSQTSDC